MTMRSLFAFFVAALLPFLSVPVSAATKDKPLAPVGNGWQVTHTDAACVVYSPFEGGYKLAFHQQYKGGLNLLVDVPAADFTADEKFDVQLGFGDVVRPMRSAGPVSPERLRIPLDGAVESPAKIAAGKDLQIITQADRQSFALTGLTEMLPSLQACLDAGAQDGVASGPKSAANGRTPFPPALLAMLRDSGLTDAEPLPDSDPSPVMDRAWRTGGLLGGALERRVPEDLGLADLSYQHLRHLQAACKGRWLPDVGEIQHLTHVDIRTATVSCSAEEGSFYASILYYRTTSGIFTAFLHQATLTQKENADAARDKLVAMVHRLDAAEDKAPAAPHAASSKANR
jgi:hypothetical protein